MRNSTPRATGSSDSGGRNVAYIIILLAISACSGVLATGGMRARAAETDPAQKAPAPRTAVLVGDAKIPVGKVLRLWRPACRAYFAARREGALPETAFQQKLQNEWDSALETLIREEIFYQEARRHFRLTIRHKADEAYDRAGGPKAGPPIVRDRMEARFLESFREWLAQYIDAIEERDIQRAGGRKRLYAYLAGQGLSWDAWHERVRRRAYVAAYHTRILPPRALRQPTPAEKRQYYRTHLEEFTKPARTTFRHLFLSVEERGEEKARRLAGDLYEQIRDGAVEMVEAVKRHSDDSPSRRAGGLEPLPEEIAETEAALSPERAEWLGIIQTEAAGLEPGELTQVLVSEAGYHILKVLGHEPPQRVPFSRVQDRLSVLVARQKRERELDEAYADLRDRLLVRVLVPSAPATDPLHLQRAFESNRGSAMEDAPDPETEASGRSEP